jgi:hypothetical protein
VGTQPASAPAGRAAIVGNGLPKDPLRTKKKQKREQRARLSRRLWAQARRRGRRVGYAIARRVLPRPVRALLRRARSVENAEPARQEAGERAPRPTEAPSLQLPTARARLLIASIFAPSHWNRQWYALQSHYIRRTTADCDYDYELVLNGVKEREISDEPLTALVVNHEGLPHASALRQTVEQLRSRKYDYYLMLDSDCFPIYPGWFSILAGQLNEFKKTIAAPIRYENLDWFPHPSAFFLTKEALHDSRLNFDEEAQPNLLGKGVSDVGSAMQSLMSDVLPLLRTNVVNRHPIGAGIYHHLFYHHASGSRRFHFRILERYGYYDHWFDVEQERACSDALRGALFGDPERFIDSLRGGDGGLEQDSPWLRSVGVAGESPRVPTERGTRRRRPRSTRKAKARSRVRVKQ